MNKFYFPFGQPLQKVQQADRTKKNAFILDVYSSAVHARWTTMGLMTYHGAELKNNRIAKI